MDYRTFLATINNASAYRALDAMEERTGGVISGRLLFEKMKSAGDVRVSPFDISDCLENVRLDFVTLVQNASTTAGQPADLNLGLCMQLGPDNMQMMPGDYFLVLVTSVDRHGTESAGSYHMMRGRHWRVNNYAALLNHLRERGSLRDVSVGFV